MGTRPRVSVIIPTLNEEAGIENTLRILNENKERVSLEVIIVDGGSTDSTCQIASRYADQVIVMSPGRGGQLNRGAENSWGEILWFLHADSQLEKDYVREIVKTTEQGIGGGCFEITFDSKRFIYQCIAWGSNQRAKWFKSFYGDQGIFVKREVFQKLGGFRPIPLMEDLEFSRRLKRGTKVQVIQRPLQTSSRRFRKGILRTLLVMQLLKLGYYLRVNPKFLSRVYGLGRG